MPDGQETRITDPATGGQKGTKLARFSLIPEDTMYDLAEHFGRGAQKYEDRNWEKGYDWKLSYDALGRHQRSFWNGDTWDVDPDVGTFRHSIAMVWHAMALHTFDIRSIGTDSRPKIWTPHG